MMKLHACKKCQGALILDKDEFGWYEECIQCGYTRDIPLDTSVDKRSTEEVIPVPVISDTSKLAEMWKHGKAPSLSPIKCFDDREGDVV